MPDPRNSREFRFIRHEYAAGEARLVYAFDDGPELIETIRFPDAPALAPEREVAFAHALQLLHLIAGVSYYKAGVPPGIRIEGAGIDQHRGPQVRGQVRAADHEHRVMVLAGEACAGEGDEVRAHAGGGGGGDVQQVAPERVKGGPKHVFDNSHRWPQDRELSAYLV